MTTKSQTPRRRRPTVAVAGAWVARLLGIRPSPRRGGRRLSLTLSFALLSLALTAGLGAVLAVQLGRNTNQDSIQELRQTTTSGISLALHTILAANLEPPAGGQLTLAQKVAQVRLITAASQTLIRDGDSIGVEAMLPNGLVIGGAGVAPLGTTVPIDARFRAALAGGTQTHILDRSQQTVASSAERRLMRQHGDLLLVQVGVRVTPASPVAVVVRSYAPTGPAKRQAAADLANTLRVLAFGLLIFWAVLFRLIVGTSAALIRESKENVFLATHDTLTGLPNRLVLRDRLEQAIVASRRSGRHVAVIVLDLDRFKEVNDTLGHQYGDTLLQNVGPRFREVLRETDTVARIGGDEFAVLLTDLSSPLQAVTIAEKLATSLHRPLELDGILVDVSGSFGIAVTTDKSDDSDHLLRRAGVAMDEAQHLNMGVVAYTPELDALTRSHLALVGELRRAIEQPEQIVLHYQPKVELSTGEVISVEALVRWQHPTAGLMAPNAFIPLAESTGIIRPLTWCILRKALIQNREWAERGILLSVAVNVSAHCLLDVTFPEQVSRLLLETGVPAERLELEITESAMLAHPHQTLAILCRLESDGIRLSIDDFGTGFSSMAYLKHLPVKEIKIDQVFVTGMANDEKDAAIVRSSIELARKLSFDVVAEGVETGDVLRQLVDLGCTRAQGFYISRPLPPSDLTRWLASRLVATKEFARPL